MAKLYIWQQDTWPEFRWNADVLLPAVADARYRHGLYLGTMAAAGLEARQEAELSATSDDIVASSAIEGEALPPSSVRSSIARRLGICGMGTAPEQSQVETMAALVLDATQNWSQPLTAERLFGWHRSLFAPANVERHPIEVGDWRFDAHGRMQVVSSDHAGGKPPKVHFEAPPAIQVPQEMARFLEWFEVGVRNHDGLLRAGVAHLWFVTLHPFNDGNGRIGRAICDMAIAQAEGRGQRYYSLSTAILKQRRAYYDHLERAQKGDLDITDWLVWFLACHTRAIEQAQTTAARVIAKSTFWASLEASRLPVNERQRKVIGRLLEDWEGPMTTRKWVAICGCSDDTAQRDIAGLVARGLLVPNEKGGRSVGYTFNDPAKIAGRRKS